MKAIWTSFQTQIFTNIVFIWGVYVSEIEVTSRGCTVHNVEDSKKQLMGSSSLLNNSTLCGYVQMTVPDEKQHQNRMLLSPKFPFKLTANKDWQFMLDYHAVGQKSSYASFSHIISAYLMNNRCRIKVRQSNWLSDVH